jgi:uncharacterized protein YgfB (UPF0149 family)
MAEASVTFDDIEAYLRRLELDMSASECHGQLTGLVCARGELDKAAWSQFLVREHNAGDLLAGEALQALEELRSETVSELADAVLDFHLLLPADTLSVEARVEALGDWCQGFLLGLAEGGVSDIDKLPADSREIIKDLVEIGRAGGYELEDSEEDEQSFFQLLEYVRTGVLLINEELHPIKAPPREDVTIH